MVWGNQGCIHVNVFLEGITFSVYIRFLSLNSKKILCLPYKWICVFFVFHTFTKCFINGTHDKTRWCQILHGSGSPNKTKKVRAALCYNAKNTQLSRLHNNANIITLGQRLISKKKAFNLINIFLNTKFEGGRHLRRIKKIL